MIETLGGFDPTALGRFDAVIDVRSPAEFADDHIPGSINLPVLEDDERAEVGTIYVQESRLKARRIGAALVARNIGRHLEGPLSDKSGSFMPLIYCWRGGQRSTAMASVLSQVGWRVAVLSGGYKTYRRWVTGALYGDEPLFRVVLLDGNTGSAKTDLLGRTRDLGVQVLDLEGLAQHRGSLFGALPGQPQPSQKTFESRLALALGTIDPAEPVLLEAESSKIGDLMIPPAVWKAMLAAPRIELAAPGEARAKYLVEAYGDAVSEPSTLEVILRRLPRHLGRKSLEAWRDLATARDFEGLAHALIEAHYDPAYERARRRDPRSALGTVAMAGLAPAQREAAAGAVAELVRGISRSAWSAAVGPTPGFGGRRLPR
jgi:tRNA 2-selenouridine synthase